jgi:molybdopterin converting factor small subunit
VSVSVRIPTPLRSITQGRAEVDAEGATVADLIVHLDGQFPGLRERLCDDTGAIRRFVNVYVGDEDIRFLQGLQTPLPAGTQVSIIPAVAGG